MGRGRAVRIGDGEFCMPVSKSYSNGDNKMSVSDKSTMAMIIPRNPFVVSTNKYFIELQKWKCAG